MIEVCVCSVFDGKAVARLVFPGLLKGLVCCERFETYWWSHWHLDVTCCSQRCETMKPTICQEIQNPSFQISFNKSSCYQPLVRHLLIVRFFSWWLTVDFDCYLTRRCSASFGHEPSSWNATVAPISMATRLPLTSAPPLHNQWERESEWILTLKSCCVIR